MNIDNKYILLILILQYCGGHYLDGNDDNSLSDVKVEESCTGESFQPICHSTRDVVLITSAQYGRFKIGKCITNEEISSLGSDPKYLGCHSNVLNLLHKKCSLKPTCEIKIPNSDMDKTNPCNPGLKLYLQSEYICIHVVTQNPTCRIQATQHSKYLAIISNNSQCGTNTNPWIVETSKGQKIQFTLEALMPTLSPDIHLNICNEEIGVIFERSYKESKNITICSNGHMLSSMNDITVGGKKNSYTSSSSSVELIIKALTKNFEDVMSLLRIEAEGCTDIIPPEDSWLKRTGDEIVIGCYSSKKTWYLRCEARKWIGVIGNCSQIGIDSKLMSKSKDLQETSTEVSKEQQVVLLVIICGFGLVICTVIVCIGFICLKRYSLKEKHPNIYNGIYHGNYSTNYQMQNETQRGSNTLYNAKQCDFNDDNLSVTGEKSEENKYFILEDQPK